MNNFTYIRGDLEIIDNLNLADISGLNNLCRVNEDFIIRNNSFLCTSAAESLETQVQTCDGGGIGDDIIIEGNQACP